MTIENDDPSRWETPATGAATVSSRFLRFRIVIVSTLAVFLIWQVMTRSITAYLADASPDEAIRLSSINPTALLNLADVTLNPATDVVEPTPTTTHTPSDDKGQPQSISASDSARTRNLNDGFITGSAKIDSQARAQIRSWAELALLNDPLNARALRILGQLAQRDSEKPRADALMRAAARRSIHESLAVFWMMRKSYEDGDYGTALHFADTLLRTRSQASALELLMPMFAKIAETPRASVELKQLLATNPSWRRQFFHRLPDSTSDPRTPLDIFLALSSSPKPPTAADLSSYLDFLVDHEFYELAYYAWLQFLPDEQLGNAGRLYNGSFDIVPSGLPFDWTFTKGKGVNINVITRPEKNGEHALFAEFGPGRVEFGSVTQLVLLSPGTYHFQGKYKVDLVSQRGLQWRVICAGKEQTQIGESPTVNGSERVWKDFEFSFTVPETACPAQYVRLILDARSESEKLVSGSIWYGDLIITRDPGLNQDPE